MSYAIFFMYYYAIPVLLFLLDTMIATIALAPYATTLVYWYCMCIIDRTVSIGYLGIIIFFLLLEHCMYYDTLTLPLWYLVPLTISTLALRHYIEQRTSAVITLFVLSQLVYLGLLLPLQLGQPMQALYILTIICGNIVCVTLISLIKNVVN